MKVYITKKQIYNIRPGTKFIYKGNKQHALVGLVNLMSGVEHRSYLCTDQDICTVAANLLGINNEEYFGQVDCKYLYKKYHYTYATLEIISETDKSITLLGLDEHRKFGQYKIKKSDLMYKSLYADEATIKLECKNELFNAISKQEKELEQMKKDYNDNY